MVKILSYIFFVFLTNFGFSQEREVLYNNNEFTLTYVKFDSTHSIIQTIREHDICHNFGTFIIHNDTITFTENIDTFLLIDPLIFYDYDDKIPNGSLKLESKFDFWQATYWGSWSFDVSYHINDSIKFECNDVFNKRNFDHVLIIPIQTSSFDLEITTNDLLKSDKLKVNLLPEEYYRNFKIQENKPNLYNHVVIKGKVVGTMPLLGLYLKDYAPTKITFKGKTYVFTVKLK